MALHLDILIQSIQDRLNSVQNLNSWDRRLTKAVKAIIDTHEADAYLGVFDAKVKGAPLEGAKWIHALRSVEEDREALAPRPQHLNRQIDSALFINQTALTHYQFLRKGDQVARMRETATGIARQALQNMMTHAQAKLAAFVDNHISNFESPLKTQI